MNKEINTEGSAEMPARPRRKAALVAGSLLAATGVAAGGMFLAGAFFTSTAEVPGQTVGTATVEITAETKSGMTPINVSNMLPGDTQPTDIDLVNSGTADVYYSITLPQDVSTDSNLANALIVEVSTDGVTVAESLSTWQTGKFQLASPLTSGIMKPINVTASLPQDATDKNLQGKSARFTVQVDAIQVKNTPTPDSSGFVVTP